MYPYLWLQALRLAVTVCSLSNVSSQLRSSYSVSKYCFRRRVYVCLSAQNLEDLWSENDVSWSEYLSCGEVVGKKWHLTLTFNLESYCRNFSAQAIALQWLNLSTSFSIWSLKISILPSRIKVTKLFSRSRSQNCWGAGLCSPPTQFNYKLQQWNVGLQRLIDKNRLIK